MFGSRMFSMFDDEPFFQQQSQMMNSVASFGMMDPFEMMNPARSQLVHRSMDPFSRMDQMMRQMMVPMDPFARGGLPNTGQSFSYSSVKTFSNTGSAEPQFYEATSSTRCGPDGVREERKTVRDSSGLHKMSVGHHIKERGHVIERIHNKKNGDREENVNFINMDESDADGFHREWDMRTRPHTSHHPKRLHDHSKRRRKALPSSANEY